MTLQKYLTIVLICLLFLNQNAFSQFFLQGTVMDNGAEFLGNGAEPVHNVLVTLTDQTNSSRTYSAYTNELGVYEILIPGTGVDDMDIQQPGKFQLLQNYPNPFNPSTVIGYEIPHPANIRIEIYNILGQKIKTLVDGFQSQPIGYIAWDATNDFGHGVSAGVYFYTFTAEGITTSKKMLLFDGHQGDAAVVGSKQVGRFALHRHVLKKQSSDLYTLKITGDSIETYERQNIEITGNTVLNATVNLTVTDIDGNVYRTIKIGNQWWMAENLKTTRYNNGNQIPNVTGDSEWQNLKTPAYCWCENNIDYKDVYGGLYNWYAVNTGKLAPTGWHVPTKTEWTELINYLGGENVAGGKLKEHNSTHWLNPNNAATNETGFTALGVGVRDNTFLLQKEANYIWSSTSDASDNLQALQVHLHWSASWANLYSMQKFSGFTVRCIKDPSINEKLKYLGQTPPDNNLVRFGPGIITDWFHSEVTVSPDGREIYWTDGTSIYFTKLQNESWTTPQIVPFSGQGTEYYYDDVPVVSPDNKKLFFLSKRPINYSSPSQENIWYVERILSGWSEPQPLPQKINSIPEIHWQISVATNGTIYYSASDKLYFSRLINSEYTAPELLQTINAFGNLTCPFIAPDESYIIFCKLEQFEGKMFICFKGKDGQWLTPQQLNGIPAPTSFVSRDGKYLFVNRYWRSAEFIEDLRPK